MAKKRKMVAPTMAEIKERLYEAYLLADAAADLYAKSAQEPVTIKSFVVRAGERAKIRREVEDSCLDADTKKAILAATKATK